METGRSYSLVEITATVYEVGARAYVHNGGFDDDDNYFEHDKIILPEPLRHYDQWDKRKFDTGNEHYPEYGVVCDRTFITLIPFIGLDFRNISEGGSCPDIDFPSGLDADIENADYDVYDEFLPEIMEEINISIDGIVDHFPMKNRWKEPSLVYTFRFTVAIEHIYEKYYIWDAWGYEYDQVVNWMGRVDIRAMCQQLTPQD